MLDRTVPAIPWSRALVAAVVPYVACTTPAFLISTLAIRLREDLDFDERGLGALLACGCPKSCRGWSGGMFVFVDEAIAAGHPHEATTTRRGML